MPRNWTRTYCEDLTRLDVRGFLPGRSGRPNLLNSGDMFVCRWESRGQMTNAAIIRSNQGYLILEYQEGGGNNQLVIRLDRTTCNLGGERTWFLCPCCGKRVAVLYGWGRFQCRTCAGIRYKSQNETVQDRAIRRTEKIRRRLEWIPGVANSWGPRPKGMHSRTFLSLTETYRREEQLVWVGLKDWLVNRSNLTY